MPWKDGTGCFPQDAEFYEKFYRMDESAGDDWPSVVVAAPAAAPATGFARLTPEEAQMNEFLERSVLPQNHYSIPRITTEFAPDGTEAEVTSGTPGLENLVFIRARAGGNPGGGRGEMAGSGWL